MSTEIHRSRLLPKRQRTLPKALRGRLLDESLHYNDPKLLNSRGWCLQENLLAPRKGLIWAREGYASYPGPSTYRAPSWSWAARNCPVSYTTHDHGFEESYLAEIQESKTISTRPIVLEKSAADVSSLEDSSDKGELSSPRIYERFEKTTLSTSSCTKTTPI